MLPVPYIVRRTWTVFLIFQSQMICIRGDCGPPPVIPYTKPVTETSGVLGGTVVYECDRSIGYYEISGQSRTSTCQDNNTWSSVPEFCARSCVVPEVLSFAKPKNRDLEREIFPPGTKVSYDCRDGYKRVAFSSNIVTCLDNYTWAIPSDFCERKRCEHPKDLQNGDFEASDGFLFGSRLTYKCNEGYRLASKRNYRDCRADGTWSNDVPECQVSICPEPNRPVNGAYSPENDEYHYLDAVTFTCNKGFHVVGSTSASCNSEGTWSENSPTCKAVECQDPGEVQNGRKDSGFVGPYTLQSAVSYKCDDNFAMNSSGSITCSINSQWDPAIPKCLPVCHTPPKPPYAELEERFTNLKYFDQTTVSYKCKSGYTGDSTTANNITCSERSWSTLAMSCSPISCGDPGTVNHADLSGSAFTFGSRVNYTCQKGYVMISSIIYRECQANGKWSDGDIICSVLPHDGNLGLLAIAGIVLGCVLALIVAFVLCRCCCLKKKSGKPKSETPNVQYSACSNA